MSRTHLVIPDCHAHPEYSNVRADYLGALIADLRPDVVVNIGDTWDMSALSSYDKGKRDFQGRTYKADIDAGLDFSERMFAPIRRLKKRQPYKVFIVGNHEQRIERALDLSPELVGTISYDDLDLKRDYNEIVPYSGNYPGSIEIDGVLYAHFLVTGVSGRPVGGEHPAYTLVSKKFQSCTVGHSHVLDFCCRSDGNGRMVQGLVAGSYLDFAPDWAGSELTKLWVPGVAICRDVDQGQYDFQWVSMEALRRAYG